MTKGSILWDAINSFFMFLLWVFMLCTIGELPNVKKRVNENEIKIKMIDYHLNCTYPMDTIVINLKER